MNRLMFYSLSVVVCSGMFFLLYNVFVSRKAGYTFCRRYLLVTMLLSIVIPSLNVPLYHKVVRADKPVAAVSTSNAVQAPEMVYLDAETQTHVSVQAAKQAAGESAVAASDAAQPAVAASGPHQVEYSYCLCICCRPAFVPGAYNKERDLYFGCA